MAKNILFADNEDRIMYEYKKLNEKFGNVVVASSVPTLIDRLAERHYDIAIVDPLELTVGAYMSMLSVHERVRDVVARINAEKTPVIFAVSGIEPEVFGLRRGKDYYFVHTKPYLVDQLIEQIEVLTGDFQ